MSESINNNLVSTFHIGDTRWGINIMNTQEIIKIPDITEVHHAPDYVEGIINLRGKIVTILSICKKLEIPSNGESSDNRIIIVNYNDEYVGLLVDSISDVIEVDLHALMPAPASVNGTKGHYFHGIYHHENLTIAILDLNEVLNMEEDDL